jgi:hypothetical protein
MKKVFFLLFALSFAFIAASCEHARPAIEQDDPLPDFSMQCGSFEGTAKSNVEYSLLTKIAVETKKRGGATVDVVSGQFYSKGEKAIVVSLAGGTNVDINISCEELVKAIDDFICGHPLAMSEIYFFGTWADAATKKLYLDVNMLFQYNNENERREALIAANNSGLENNQTTLYDMGSGLYYKVAKLNPGETPKLAK